MNISTSLICCDLSNISKDVEIILNNGYNWFHADFMDGHFVPRYGISPELIMALKKRYGNKIIIDSHLMVDDPYTYTEVIAPYSDWFFFHYEATKDPMRTLQMLRKKYPNLKIGLAFNVLTSVTNVLNIIEIADGYIDGVMFMGISPGVLGTDSFTAEINNKLDVTRRFYDTRSGLIIFIDGSVNFNSLGGYVKNGANVCVSGSSMIFKGNNEMDNGCVDRAQLVSTNINKINNIINEARK